MNEPQWETLVGPGKGVTRDRYGRPLLRPKPGESPIPFTRVTTVAKTLEDQSALMLWKQRMTALGIVARRDLHTAIAATSPTDKAELNRLTEQAADAGGATAAATVGTALHAFLERFDRGEDLGHVPEEHVKDIEAYADLKQQVGWQTVETEVFLALGTYRIAGTADRVLALPDGKHYIADVKTGTSVQYHHAWAIQTCIYARSLRYDVETERRIPWDVVPDQDRALIIHVPAGEGRAAAYWIDIAAGWQALTLSMKAREWRKARNLLKPYDADPIAEAIDTARTVADLNSVWADNQDRWTDEHTSRAAARKQTLTQPA